MKRIFPLLIAALFLGVTGSQAADITLLNASYDPTRDIYKVLGDGFAGQ